MRRDKLSTVFIAILLIMAVPFTCTRRAAASEFKVLHVFNWAKNPEGKLVMDAAGNLYGTTANGGANGYGVVYKLVHNADGTWKATILHSFTGQDGSEPYAGMIFDAAGNLYGTTLSGGTGAGVVFKLAPNPGGTWTESVLHTFSWYADGFESSAGLIFDASGNLYGTTSAGSIYGFGAVFKLAPLPDGSWTESVLYAFTRGDGAYPKAGLVFDAAGNLYGTTELGGDMNCGDILYGCGTVFKLAHQPDGSWTESVLNRFCSLANCADGLYPWGGLIQDAAGNLYGMTDLGGSTGNGTVFKLAHQMDGSWTESVLHNFCSFPACADGANPFYGSLVFDAAGSLYGTTMYGGCQGNGVVFKLTNTKSGWKETVLHTFSGYGTHPDSTLLVDKAGNVYGSVPEGSNNSGFVFEITP